MSAVAALLLAAAPLAAQDNSTVSEPPAAPAPAENIGPRELQNFSLEGTVTRRAEEPAAPPATPAVRETARRDTAPAPTEAAIPTRNVSQVLWVAKAAANNGARVETEPSISPASPGWTTCRTNIRWRVSSSARRASVVRCCSPRRCARLMWERSAAARSPSSLRMLASEVRSMARS